MLPRLSKCPLFNRRSSLIIPSFDNHYRCPSMHLDRFYLLTPPLDNAQAPWLVRAREYEPNKWKLLQFYVKDGENLFLSTPKVTANISLLDYGIEELSTSWSVAAMSLSGLDHLTISEKVVGGWNFQGDKYVFTVLIQLENTSSQSGLKLLRLDKEGNFTIDELFGEQPDCLITDIAYYNRHFYVFDKNSWQIRIIDPELLTIKMNYIAAPCQVCDPFFVKNVYFLPSRDHFFLVVDASSFNKSSLILYVFKQHKWERVDGLDDNIFFVGKFVSFTLPFTSKRLPWKPGSICFFHKPSITTHPYPYIIPKGAEALESVCCEDFRQCLDLYSPEDQEKGVVPFTSLDPKIYTGLFFPPPPWVKWECVEPNGAAVRFRGFEFKLAAFNSNNFLTYDNSDDDDNEDDDILGNSDADSADDGANFNTAATDDHDDDNIPGNFDDTDN